MTPLANRRFLHRRYRTDTTPRQPEACRITRVTDTTVYYRVGPEPGAKVRTARDGFEDRCVLEWLPHDTN